MFRHSDDDIGKKLSAQYNSYLLRVWRPNPNAALRILIEVIPGSERRAFTDMEELCTFLIARLESPPTDE